MFSIWICCSYSKTSRSDILRHFARKSFNVCIIQNINYINKLFWYNRSRNTVLHSLQFYLSRMNGVQDCKREIFLNQKVLGRFGSHNKENCLYLRFPLELNENPFLPLSFQGFKNCLYNGA